MINCYHKWKEIYHKGNGYDYGDAISLNLLRFLIFYYKKKCVEELQLFDYPDPFYFPEPKKVPECFSADCKNKLPYSEVVKFEWSDDF